MGSSSDLVDRLDFNIVLGFQEKIRQRFRTPVHHPSPSADGSFLLLVTFRRFLFCLTEDSVSLALQSCLGGRAADFHVKFLSNNHFRFSVFSKDVGFQVYKLRCVITDTFDAYFHLWHNGTPNWEKEKRAWELERKKSGPKYYPNQPKGHSRKQNPLSSVCALQRNWFSHQRKLCPLLPLIWPLVLMWFKLILLRSMHIPLVPPILPFFEVHSVFFAFRMNTHVAISLENAIPVIGLSLCRAFRGRDLGTLRI
jgi:hypothetical protein